MNGENKNMTKREKIITLVSGILIVGLAFVAVFEFFTIMKTQRMLNEISDSQSTTLSDGKIVWVNPETTVLLQENENISDITTTTEISSEKTTYVLNKNSKKIHSPECDSAKQTLDKNKETVEWSDEEYFKALDEGYSPCSICKAGR